MLVLSPMSSIVVHSCISSCQSGVCANDERAWKAKKSRKIRFIFAIFIAKVYKIIIIAGHKLSTFSYFCTVKRKIGLIVGFLLLSFAVMAQDKKRQEVDMDSPTFVPTVKVGKVLEDGDSIQYMEMNNVYVFPPITFSSKKQQNAYMRLVKNVKTVLPIAKEARLIMMETAEYLETLPNKEAKDEHMKRVEKSIMKEYKPRMKKLTYSQGKLLIKLIYRESNSSGYELIQAFLGPVRAGFYQAFAWAFGASLKKEYDPEGIDRLTERVVLMVEAGQI